MLLSERVAQRESGIRRALALDAPGLRRLAAAAGEGGARIEVVDEGSVDPLWRLATAFVPLQRERLEREIRRRARGAFHSLEVLSSIDSTNAYLLRQSGRGLANGRLALAEFQTAGRGRRGRIWLGHYGCGVLASAHWRFGSDARLEGLSLAIGVGLVESLSEEGFEGLGLKWPNDVYAGGRKLAGILIETGKHPGGDWFTVTGVGLNVSQPPAGAPETERRWTALEDLRGGPLDRTRIAAVVGSAVLRALSAFEAEGFAKARARWESYDLAAGRPARVILAGEAVEGVGQGITEYGAFRLDTGAGVREFHAGEVSFGSCRNERTADEIVKWLTLLLFAANIAFMAWRLQAVPVVPDESRTVRPGRATINRLLLLSEVDPSELRMRRGSEPLSVAAGNGAEVATAAPGESAGGARCGTVGPLPDGAQRERVRVWLESHGARLRLRPGKRREMVLYWIYLPPFPSRNAARRQVAELAAKGIDDIFVINWGNMADAISLGVYSRRASLERRIKELRGAGYSPRVVERTRQEKATWYDIRLEGGEALPEEAFSAEFSTLSLRESACRKDFAEDRPSRSREGQPASPIGLQSR